MANVPRIPQEVVDEILDHLAVDSDVGSLRLPALVSKSWVHPCRRHLFCSVFFDSKRMDRWLKTFPVPEESPARHVRNIRFWIGGDSAVPERSLEYTSSFPNVKSISLIWFGPEGHTLFQTPTFWKFPLSVTSLTIGADVASLTQVQAIVAQLPKLDDLSLTGPLEAIGADRGGFRGTGTPAMGIFGGRLELSRGCDDNDFMKMLLDIPIRLHFTEVEIRGTHEYFLSTVRFVEGCCKTLVRLSYVATSQGKFFPFLCSSCFQHAS